MYSAASKPGPHRKPLHYYLQNKRKQTALGMHPGLLFFSGKQIFSFLLNSLWQLFGHGVVACRSTTS
jgi:hypothetical protein